MDLHLPRVKGGDPVEADLVNRFFDACDALGIDVDAASGLERSGDVLRSSRPRRIIIALTARSGSSYAWTQKLRSGGAWVDGPISGTTTSDPAIEVNGNTAVVTSPATFVYAWRAGTDLVFQASQC